MGGVAPQVACNWERVRAQSLQVETPETLYCGIWGIAETTLW